MNFFSFPVYVFNFQKLLNLYHNKCTHKEEICNRCLKSINNTSKNDIIQLLLRYFVNVLKQNILKSFPWNFDKTQEKLNINPESSASKRFKISELISSKTITESEAETEKQKTLIALLINLLS